MGRPGGKSAKSLGQKLLQRYLRWHLDRVFSGSDSVREPSRVLDVVYPKHIGSELDRVRRELARAQRPVFLIGSQAMLNTAKADELAAALGRIGVPCYLSGMARGLLGASHPLLMRHKRREALREADLVLLAGVPCDFRLDYGNHIGRARYLAVNRSREDLYKNRRPAVAVLGDPGDFLRELGSGAKGAGQDAAATRWQPWLETLCGREKAREADIDAQAGPGEKAGPAAQTGPVAQAGPAAGSAPAAPSGDAAPAGADSAPSIQGINPLELFRRLNTMLDDRAVLVADGGDFVGSAAYTLHARTPLSWLDPGAFGTLGVGGGFALGAGLCRPDAEVWIIWGDGSSAYSLAEFDAFARHGVPVIGLVGNDACWAQIARDQVDILKDDVAVMLAHSDYDQVAAGYGGAGRRVSTIEEFTEAVREARACVQQGKPFLINAILAKSDFRKGSISM
jgi:thiamine pyrophosphate-dependent acetolactate synthase large subunit-like protein